VLTRFGEHDYIDLITTTQEGSEMEYEEDYYDESHPADYGYGGFENWDDFNDYCDEFEQGLDWE
jgi:broad specificity phosphatase PhoE